MPLLPVRIGQGFDVHAFAAGQRLVLGGVEIPHEKGLLGHSDADALTHAVCDAILGALARGDIGQHFPDTDPRYKNIDSLLLLDHVAALARQDGYSVAQIDATILAQRPRLAGYMPQMQEKLRARLGGDCIVNVKATTTERLGFVGREEGIAAMAVVMLTPVKPAKRAGKRAEK